jgi:hypothetical protein
MSIQVRRNHKSLPSRRRVRACIDDAEKAFTQCWQTLVAMKSLKPDAKEMFQFQPTLATALFKLDEMYRRLTEARKRLIRDKASHPAAWFERRMRSSDKDLKGLRSAMDVGRSLGDAFAWLFYKQDQPLLERHFKQPLNPHTPAGIGGIGELEFVRQARPVGFFMLYHGITTFLRIGDVSFYDFASGRISSIGELKSTPIEPGRLTVTVHVTGKIGDKIPFVSSTSKSEVTEPLPTRAGHRDFEDRLKKQLKIAAELSRSEGASGKACLLDAYHMNEFGLFARELSERGIAYQQVGQGLLIAGAVAFRGRSLAGRIFSKTSEKSVLKRMQKITQHVTALADPTLPDNSIHFSELDNRVRLGWPPLFWYPCEADFLEALYFQRLMLATVYNPAHLFKRLRALGYQVVLEAAKDGGPPAVKVTKKSPNGVMMRVEHFDFFLRLIQHRFMREERIVEMLAAGDREAPQIGPGEAARVQFGFVHVF